MNRTGCAGSVTGRRCSPQARGWTGAIPAPEAPKAVFPAGAGVDRPSRRRRCRWCRCSPQARGWTEDTDGRRYAPRVPRRRGGGPRRDERGIGRARLRVPRRRGGGPGGDDPRMTTPCGVPRRRGGGPLATFGWRPAERRPCSPQARGWTADRPADLPARCRRVPRKRGGGPDRCQLQSRHRLVFPASAGVDREARSSLRAASCVPRKRGGGPPGQDWNDSAMTVFPASAGVDRTPTRRITRSSSVPRKRGGGPG